MTDPAGAEQDVDPGRLYQAIQVLGENLTRGISDDLTEAAGLKARGRDGELLIIARIFARTMDAYGTPARDVLAATDVSDELIRLLDR